MCILTKLVEWPLIFLSLSFLCRMGTCYVKWPGGGVGASYRVHTAFLSHLGATEATLSGPNLNVLELGSPIVAVQGQEARPHLQGWDGRVCDT